MDILTQIVANTKKELQTRKQNCSVKELEKTANYKKNRISLSQAIRDKSGTAIIAEIKFKSPSSGKLHDKIEPAKIGLGYQTAGATAISVLTDEKYFSGKTEYLTKTREVTEIPILRKDFILEEYQIVEARAIGADAILLLAAILKPKELLRLARFANAIGLETLLEIHDEQLADYLTPAINLVGINNRNLKTFEVNIKNSLKLVEQIPANYCKLSESGLSSADTIKKLVQAKFDGFLIGETFMKSDNPAKSLEKLLSELK